MLFFTRVCILHLQHMAIWTSHISRAQEPLVVWLPFWTKQLLRSKTAEVISFLVCFYDGYTGKIDQPTQTGQVARQGT